MEKLCTLRNEDVKLGSSMKFQQAESSCVLDFISSIKPVLFTGQFTYA